VLKTFLCSKIHQARVTKADLNYQGSITIDSLILKKSGISVYEQVHVLNISNGQRFITYTIEGKENSGAIQVNGAAARLTQVGDLLIILSYIYLENSELNSHRPKVLFLGENNKIKTI